MRPHVKGDIVPAKVGRACHLDVGQLMLQFGLGTPTTHIKELVVDGTGRRPDGGARRGRWGRGKADGGGV